MSETPEPVDPAALRRGIRYGLLFLYGGLALIATLCVLGLSLTR